MPATFTLAVPVTSTRIADDYRGLGWTVSVTADGIELVTDARIAAVELTGVRAAMVRRYLRANNLSGPVIEIQGRERREIHLVVGAGKALRAIEMLRESGATVYTDGARVALPAGDPAMGWGIAPGEARWVPPLVALSAAVTAANRSNRSNLRKLAC